MTQNQCSNCGTEFGSDERFCPQCGTPVGSTEKCPRCGQPLMPGEHFCGECGYQIVAPVRKRPSWLWFGAGGMGLLGVAAIVVFLVLPNLRSQAVSTPTRVPTFAPTNTPAPITPAVAKTTVTWTPSAALSPTPTATPVKADTHVSPTPTVSEGTPSPAPVTPTHTPTRKAEGYRIAEGDWLSRIAESVYGDPLAYRAIVHLTNRRCTESGSPFHCVPDPDRIEVGWYLYLPTDQEIEEYWWAQYAGLPPCDPSQVTGEVEAIGSSTVYLITRRIGQRLAKEGAMFEPRVASVGTTAGFERFCGQKQGDLVNASRAITAQERATCQANGRDPIELQIGTDALVIAVSAQNEFLNQLSFAQLRRAFTDALYWSDIDPMWPALPINRFIPGQDSGTFDFFVEDVLDGNRPALLSASGLTTSENDELLVMGVAGDPAAIGFFGYAYYRDNSDRLRALVIDEVAPRQETADTGTYPLTRPLFIYTTADILNEKPHVAAFCNCYLQWVRDEILDVGYFMPDEDAFARSVTTFGQTYR